MWQRFYSVIIAQLRRILWQLPAQEAIPVEQTKEAATEDEKPKVTTAEDYRVSLDFVVTKQEDNSRLLVATYEGKNKKDRKDIMPVYNAEIKFYNVPVIMRYFWEQPKHQNQDSQN